MVSFFKNTRNIVGSSMERMPFLFTNRILRNYREALKKPELRELAKAKAATGWAFMIAFVFGTLEFLEDLMLQYGGREGYLLKRASNKQPKAFRFHNFLNEKFPVAE